MPPCDADHALLPKSTPTTKQRESHDSVDGKVLVAGGFNEYGSDGASGRVASAELYDASRRP